MAKKVYAKLDELKVYRKSFLDEGEAMIAHAQELTARYAPLNWNDNMRDVNTEILNGHFENANKIITATMGMAKQVDKLIECLEAYFAATNHISGI